MDLLLSSLVHEEEEKERQGEPDDLDPFSNKKSLRVFGDVLKDNALGENREDDAEEHADREETHHEDAPEEIGAHIGDMDVEEIIAYEEHKNEHDGEDNKATVDGQKGKDRIREDVHDRGSDISVEDNVHQLGASEIEAEHEAGGHEKKPKGDVPSDGARDIAGYLVRDERFHKKGSK